MKVEQSLEQSPIVLLKAKVQERFGRPVMTYRDCLLLHEDILTRTSLSLNQNTLRRFFGVVKSTGGPSRVTVDILVRYCGYHSLAELQHHMDHQGEEDTFISQESITAYIINLFTNTPVRRVNDETFLAVTKGVIQFLQKYPALTYNLQREIAKTKSGKEFYFEQFVHIDALATTYGDGLRYYLKEHKETEAQIFGISLLFLRAWLTGDKEGMEIWYEQSLKKTLSKDIHPFVQGRYFASRLYYANAFDGAIEKILEEARLAHLSIAPIGENWRSFPAFEYSMSIALVLTGAYEEALYYLSCAEGHYKVKHSYVEDGYYETLALLKGLALAKEGRLSEANKVYKGINPIKFYFLNKKVCTILHLVLAGCLGRREQSGEKQLQLLIEETGLIKFTQFI